MVETEIQILGGCFCLLFFFEGGLGGLCSLGVGLEGGWCPTCPSPSLKSRDFVLCNLDTNLV